VLVSRRVLRGDLFPPPVCDVTCCWCTSPPLRLALFSFLCPMEGGRQPVADPASGMSSRPRGGRPPIPAAQAQLAARQPLSEGWAAAVATQTGGRLPAAGSLHALMRVDAGVEADDAARAAASARSPHQSSQLPPTTLFSQPASFYYDSGPTAAFEEHGILPVCTIAPPSVSMPINTAQQSVYELHKLPIVTNHVNGEESMTHGQATGSVATGPSTNPQQQPCSSAIRRPTAAGLVLPRSRPSQQAAHVTAMAASPRLLGAPAGVSQDLGDGSVAALPRSASRRKPVRRGGTLTKKPRTASGPTRSGLAVTDAAAAPGTASLGPPASRTLTAADIKCAVRDAIQPLSDVVCKCVQDASDLTSSVNRLARKVDTQGQGYETTAKAVVDLHAAVARPTGQKLPSVPQPGRSGGRTNTPKDKISVAAANFEEMDNIRQELKATVQKQTADTDISRLVMYDSDRAWGSVLAAVTAVRGCTPPEATNYLLTARLFPVRGNREATKKKRPLKALNMVIPHFLQDLKDNALKPFWQTVHVDPKKLTRVTALKWLNNKEYLESYKGRKGLVAAGKRMMRCLNAPERIVKTPGVGGGDHLILCAGHYGMLSSFVRHILLVAAGLRKPRRTGKTAGAYKRWREEMVLVDKFLPKDDTVHDGLRIIDGADTNRAVLPSGSADAAGEAADESGSSSDGGYESDGASGGEKEGDAHRPAEGWAGAGGPSDEEVAVRKDAVGDESGDCDESGESGESSGKSGEGEEDSEDGGGE